MTTSNDRQVLDAIFSPLLPNSRVTEDAEHWTTDQLTDEDPAAKAVELQGVKAAETGELDKAIELLSNAIALSPDRPSCYNNRAQAFSLKGEINRALADLDSAISLCNDDQPQKVAGAAYTQRGIIHKMKENMPAALSDFKKAAALGNVFAKQQVVDCNPMAALCNKMLSDVFKKLQTGQPAD